ncbi:hypothetical protein FPQ18DRAFT_396112 [Pyronema domesticum]|nr:hypothetical protein FPQ18DRAFT_396112 [Pyronema domesticum]
MKELKKQSAARSDLFACSSKSKLVMLIARWDVETGNSIDIRWVPGHKDVPGNEQADVMAKSGAMDSSAGSPQSRRNTDYASRAFLKG